MNIRAIEYRIHKPIRYKKNVCIEVTEINTLKVLKLLHKLNYKWISGHSINKFHDRWEKYKKIILRNHHILYSMYSYCQQCISYEICNNKLIQANEFIRGYRR